MRPSSYAAIGGGVLVLGSLLIAAFAWSRLPLESTCVGPFPGKPMQIESQVAAHEAMQWSAALGIFGGFVLAAPAVATRLPGARAKVIRSAVVTLGIAGMLAAGVLSSSVALSGLENFGVNIICN